MNNTPASSAPLNGHSANGHNGIADGNVQWLDGFRLRPRIAPKAAVAHDASPAAGYIPDGTYNHGKPTDGQSQWGVKGKIPAVAFGMPDDDIAEYKRIARANAILGLSLDTVRTIGLQRFEARWAQCRFQFEASIRTGERTLERLQAKIAALATESNGLSLTVPDTLRNVALPRDWRIVPLIILCLLWLAIIPADWYLIASKQFDGAGEKTGPLFATISWLAAPFLVKWALLSRPGAVAERVLSIFKNTAVTVLLLFICIYALFGSSGSSAAHQASSLSSTMAGGATPPLAVGEVHWSIFALQILLCLFTSAALTMQIRELMVGRTPSVLHPDRQWLERDGTLLGLAANVEDTAIGPQRGNLAEYRASSDRYITFGELAWHAAKLDHELLERARQLNEQQRRMLEG